jgi:hypothetical protein
MPKIKPFIWQKTSITNHEFTQNPLCDYGVQAFAGDDGQLEWYVAGICDHAMETPFSTIQEAKRFAFDDFRKRLEETLGEPVGYDLEIDENC